MSLRGTGLVMSGVLQTLAENRPPRIICTAGFWLCRRLRECRDRSCRLRWCCRGGCRRLGLCSDDDCCSRLLRRRSHSRSVIVPSVARRCKNGANSKNGPEGPGLPTVIGCVARESHPAGRSCETSLLECFFMSVSLRWLVLLELTHREEGCQLEARLSQLLTAAGFTVDHTQYAENRRPLVNEVVAREQDLAHRM